MKGGSDSIVKFPPGSIIFCEGDEPDFAYVVLSGQVEISTRRADGRLILTKIGVNQLFGDFALLENATRSATATSVMGCELLAVSKEQFLRKLEALDPFTRYWLLYLSDRVKDLSRRIDRENQ